MKKKVTLEASGKSVTYNVDGEGIPVMLVHGFGEDGSIWENQLPSLKSFCRLIIPDLPGSGESEFDETGSLERYAEVLYEIVKLETEKPVIVIGHSMGGYITLAFAERYPDSLRAFGLFHSTAYADDSDKIETRRNGIRFIQSSGAQKFLEQSTPGLFSDQTRISQPALIDEIVARYANFKGESLVQYYESMINRPDRTNILKNSIKPVLFILGVHDSAVPMNKGLEQTHLADICYIHICNNSGHMGMLEEPEECNRALEKFIKEIS